MMMTHNVQQRICSVRPAQCLALVLALTSWCLWDEKATAEQANILVQSGNDSIAEQYQPAQGISGRVTIVGSDTMQPLMAKLAAAFRSFQPNTKFGVEGQGSSEAIREFMLGLSLQHRGDKSGGKGTQGASSSDLLASSRPLTDQERKGFVSHHGYEPIGIPIAMDAVAIYVHNDNPIEHLTLEQVDGLFSSSLKRSKGGRLTTWGQVGLKDQWSQQPIHLYGRNKKSGTREFFKHVALIDGELRDDVQEQPGSASEILAIAQDPLAVGYAGVGFQGSMVRIIPLTNEADGAAVLPSAESVANGQYPLARPLYLYVNKNQKEKLDPVVWEFVKFVNSRQGQETVARASLYPLTAAQISKNFEILGHSLVTAQNDVR
ncbi:MAG: PstS family phosphate ABC transporter substrate-binding protein [Nitrospirota bacterium]|nr:PstS family phosphate ABC transporter substrate-binding protein [Nitrospirota bacterium]MDP2381363.1 PstS family phosphate ABC transporter substrate-binding protein [Nitrospirota bacterium]MDP3596750.1 PstS family phosphate ABC transporter substrate-binding protein [Nitrospirota bacterium]